jgi:hypothetical protein
MVLRGLLEHASAAQHARVAERRSDDLQAQRQR